MRSLSMNDQDSRPSVASGRRLGLLGLALAMMLGMGTQAANAGQMFSYSGNNTQANPVDVSATFTISAGQLIVNLTNNYAPLNLHDNQTLNGVNFTLSSSVSSTV